MIKEFKEFAMRGNVMDMAVGIIIGGAFGTIVKSLVDDLLMPPIGVVVGGVDLSNFFIILRQGRAPGPYVSLAEAKAAGAVTLNYGVFLGAVTSFLIVAFAIFLLIRTINRLRRQEDVTQAAPTTKDCPYCVTKIPVNAIRCPQCTSQLAGVVAQVEARP